MTTTLPASPAPRRARSNSTLATAMRRLRKHRAAMVSLAVIVLLILTAIFAPLIAPYDPNAQDLAGIYAPPTAAHVLSLIHI